MHAFAFAFAFTLLATANNSSCDAQTVLEQMRAVTHPLPRNSSLHVAGTVSAAGLRGRYTQIIDVRSGRSALATETPIGATLRVVTGSAVWQRDASRGVHELNAPNALAGARDERFLNSQEYLRPRSNSASITCTGSGVEQGRTFDEFHVLLKGGRPMILRVDRSSHLVSKILETTPTGVTVTTLRDYRTFAGSTIPFEVTQGVLGDPADDTLFQVRSAEIHRSHHEHDFGRPIYPTDSNGSDSSIPFSLEQGDIIVQASLNGSRPMAFLLDTGGHAILTRDAARRLHLAEFGASTSGGGGASRIAVRYTKVGTLRIGHVSIPQRTFLVIPYGKDFTDRRPRPDLAGILGLELFERFTVRVDYARGLLSLTPPASVPGPQYGHATPLFFQEDMPAAYGDVDGVHALLDVDTGNSGGTILYGPFLRRNGLLARYRGGSVATGSGTGGTVHSSLHVVRTLGIGPAHFSKVISYFVVGQRTGTFSSTAEAGDVGYDMLGRFTTTFDYRHNLMYLRQTHEPQLPVFGRSGMSLRKEAVNFAVLSVRENSPAREAGIAPGDTVVSVFSKPASDLGMADIWKIMRMPVGTRVSVAFKHRGVLRTVKLRLRDLPVPGA